MSDADKLFFLFVFFCLLPFKIETFFTGESDAIYFSIVKMVYQRSKETKRENYIRTEPDI